MLKLSDFFQPLNFINLIYFILAIFFFDILGSFIKSFFIKDERIKSETRPGDWLIGLGFFVFIWFLLGFVINPGRTSLLISMCLLFVISVPYYLKNKIYGSYLHLVKQSVLPLILLIPLLPSTFVKASLPPYYSDEMAYHFISPYSVLHQLNIFWTFNGGVYLNVPRLMDNFYILGFSLTRTYSVVRLIQFSIIATAIVFSFLLIKKTLGFFSAFLFVLIYLSLPLLLPFIGTIGFVDAPADAFLLLGVILGISFFLKNRNEYLILSLIFWAMSIGTKYTTLISFVLFCSSLLLVYFLKYRSLSKILNKGLWIKILFGLIIFGIYWYIKNLIVYGNPIYPFIFPCWGKYAAGCSTGSSFFGTWTDPINFHTFYPIVIKQLLPQNILLHALLIISPLFVLFSGDKRNKLLLLLTVLPFFGELIILKYFSGFVIRYQQHLTFYLIFGIILIASCQFKNALANFVKYLLIFSLIISCLFFYYQNARYINSLHFVTWEELNYSLGKTSIYGWIRNRIPDTADSIFWCENPPGGSVALARFDPDMIWYGTGFMRSFLLNCYYENPRLDPNDLKDVIQVAKQEELQFWTVTVNPCVPDSKIVNKAEAQDSNNDTEEVYSILQLRRLNNVIVCNSKEVLPDLYYFDFKSFKQ